MTAAPQMLIRRVTYPATHNVMDVPKCPRCGKAHFMVEAHELRGDSSRLVVCERNRGYLRFYGTCPRTSQPIFVLTKEPKR